MPTNNNNGQHVFICEAVSQSYASVCACWWVALPVWEGNIARTRQKKASGASFLPAMVTCEDEQIENNTVDWIFLHMPNIYLISVVAPVLCGTRGAQHPNINKERGIILFMQGQWVTAGQRCGLWARICKAASAPDPTHIGVDSFQTRGIKIIVRARALMRKLNRIV